MADTGGIVTQYLMQPIGIIHSPFSDKAGTPIQATRSEARGQVEVYPEFEEGLQDIEGFSYITMLYVFDRSEGYALRVKPFLDNQVRGIFATRFPARPNPIGMSTVRLLARLGNRLEIEGVDVLDGTPLLDIKPYVPEFDVRSPARTGWYEVRSSR
jgi:tRNA (adenine37-N6)-methyltransferase